MTLEVDISKVRNVKGSSSKYSITIDAFDFLESSWQLNGSLSLDITITHQERSLELRGTVSGTVKGCCDRCLESVVVPIELELIEHLLYANDMSLFSHLAVGELEEQYFIYYNDMFDLTDIVRENVLAVLPQKVLCQDNCEGLCLKCGKNLNQGPCGCDLHEVDPRLAILAKLKEEVEEV